MTNDTQYPPAGEAIDRIKDLADNPGDVQAVVPLGDDGYYWYYVAVQARSYEGNNYLNERYVQLVKPELPDAEQDREDTFKTNGIHRRIEGGFVEAAEMMMELYTTVHKRLDYEREEGTLPGPAYIVE